MNSTHVLNRYSGACATCACSTHSSDASETSVRLFTYVVVLALAVAVTSLSQCAAVISTPCSYVFCFDRNRDRVYYAQYLEVPILLCDSSHSTVRVCTLQRAASDKLDQCKCW
jgi:hypothetical protein